MLTFVSLLLCLVWMSEDANNGFSETLHVRQNIGTLINQFSVNDRPVVRKLEGLQKKHTNAQYAVIFTETCMYCIKYLN